MNLVTCPNCKHEFDVTGSIQKHLREEMQREFDLKTSRAASLLDQRERELSEDRSKLEDLKKTETERLQKKLAEQSALQREELRKQIQQENETANKVLQEELNQKTIQLRELNETKAQLAKSEREKNELRESIQADAERQLNQKLEQAKSEIRQKAQDENQFAIRELQKKLKDQENLINEQKQKMEQGLTQLQGEVQELAIEEYLRTTFPLDQIEEVKKGQHGADCTQIVNSRTRLNCGRIFYESKRTKEFSGQWIDKFKSDIRASGGGIGVLVTEAMPKGFDRLGMLDGIWVCSFEEFKGLSSVLRESVLRLSEALESQENKADKMVMLYDYMAGQEFRMNIEAIVEALVDQRAQLDSERRAYESQWSKREKALDKGLKAIAVMYGGIRGIAGSAIGEIKTLELNA